MSRLHDLYPHAGPPVRDSGRVARVVHLLLSLGGWVLFAVFWVRVFYRTPSAESAVGVLMVGILLVVSISMTAAWIRHNLVLSERFRGRRLAVPDVRPDWSRDVLGREVRSPEREILENAPVVEIGIDHGGRVKTYRARSG